MLWLILAQWVILSLLLIFEVPLVWGLTSLCVIPVAYYIHLIKIHLQNAKK